MQKIDDKKNGLRSFVNGARVIFWGPHERVAFSDLPKCCRSHKLRLAQPLSHTSFDNRHGPVAHVQC